MSEWQPYGDVFAGAHRTGTGDLRVRTDVSSADLPEPRALVVHLPPGHDRASRGFPVIYMMDGQNVFDEARAHSLEWRVDETMETLSAQGLDAIIVGVDNAGPDRDAEYGAFPAVGHTSARAQAFLRLLTDEVMPDIESSFRVSTTRENTFIAGASLGGVISLYALCERPDRFGGAAIMSPSLWFGGYRALDHVTSRPPTNVRIHLDVGTREMSGRRSFLNGHRRSRQYRNATRDLHAVLRDGAVAAGRTVNYVEDRGARHGERSWSRRFPGAVRFLLGGAP